MANVRRVPDEERATAVTVGDGVLGPVIGKDDPTAVLQAGGREIAAGDRSRQRIELDANELGALEVPGGSEKEATGADSGVDDARRRALFGSPRQHSLDDGQGRVGGAEFAAFFGHRRSEKTSPSGSSPARIWSRNRSRSVPGRVCASRASFSSAVDQPGTSRAPRPRAAARRRDSVHSKLMRNVGGSTLPRG